MGSIPVWVRRHSPGKVLNLLKVKYACICIFRQVEEQISCSTSVLYCRCNVELFIHAGSYFNFCVNFTKDKNGSSKCPFPPYIAYRAHTEPVFEVGAYPNAPRSVPLLRQWIIVVISLIECLLAY